MYTHLHLIQTTHILTSKLLQSEGPNIIKKTNHIMKVQAIKPIGKSIQYTFAACLEPLSADNVLLLPLQFDCEYMYHQMK